MILGLEITLEEVVTEEEIVLLAITWGVIGYVVFAAVAIVAALLYRYTRDK